MGHSGCSVPKHTALCSKVQRTVLKHSALGSSTPHCTCTVLNVQRTVLTVLKLYFCPQKVHSNNLNTMKFTT